MASSELSALLSSSRNLTSHLSRPELPAVRLSLDQVEAQSRRLVSRQPGTTNDTDRANYLLAQAHVDASALSSSIAHLNPAATFSPLQPLQDTDVSGYLRHAHEQTLISTIEEGRKDTVAAFYRTLEERSRRDWEAKKKRVFEELGGRSAAGESRSEAKGSSKFGKSVSTAPSLTLQMQSKMMVYDRVITELNAARLRGTSYPIVHALIRASLDVAPDPRALQTTHTFHVLAKITAEPPALPPLEHASAHILNAPVLARKYARVYLGAASANDADLRALRMQIARGAREALEEQYMDVLERMVQARPSEAALGGDPSVANKVRAFLAVRYYKSGEWGGGIELVAGQPLWAKLFFLVRTGHCAEALEEALKNQQAIEHREASFVSHFRTWVESKERRLPPPHRAHLQATYNAHMLHAAAADPFKLALYKLMGKLEATRRSVGPAVTGTTEDWLWFQLGMVDEDEDGGLRGLAEVLLGYGERQFDTGGRRGVWAGVLLMCGEFERAVAALWEHQETEIEAVHLAIALAYHGLLRVPSRAETSDVSPLTLSPAAPPALSLSTLVWRYARQFVKMDAKEALQYVYCVGLAAEGGAGREQEAVGKEQLEAAWELVRRIIVLGNSGPAWEELVGGFRGDGTRFSGVIEQGAALLHLRDAREFNEKILVKAAQHAAENDRVPEAVKLYNLAGEYSTVTACLAQALGNTIGLPGADEKARAVERTAADILRGYERTNRAVGKERDAVVRLLRVREAVDAREAGRPDLALEIMESTDLIPLDGDVGRITRRAEEFKDLHEALQRNLQTYLPLTMDALAGVHQRAKAAMGPADATRQMTLTALRKKSRSLMIFAGILKYRMSPDVYSYLARLDVEIAL
ncbi:nucleoporin-interacting protein NIC96 [Mycena rebaudengoi]|nr:nucleoporin-interacting protein NIC96 [Mycena rebaudengoi]